LLLLRVTVCHGVMTPYMLASCAIDSLPGSGCGRNV
jgi:hypothetical protein